MNFDYTSLLVTLITFPTFYYNYLETNGDDQTFLQWTSLHAHSDFTIHIFLYLSDNIISIPSSFPLPFVPSFFFFPFPLWFITGTEYSFLCYTVGPCCLSILYVVCFWTVFSKWRSRNVQKKENNNWNVPSFLISPTQHILLVLGVWQNEGYERWPHMK